MCSPAAIGMVLQVAGGAGVGMTESNYRNALNAEGKRAFEVSRDARADERERQLGFEGEANQNFVTTLGAFGRPQHDAAVEASASNFVNTLNADPDAAAIKVAQPGWGNASGAVSSAIAREVNKAADAARKQAKALADVKAYGGIGTKNAQTFSEAGNFASTLGGLRRGSLGVAQQEQTIAPAQVERGSDTFARLLMGAGGLVSGAAGSGMLSGGSMPTMIDVHNPSWLFGGQP